MSSVFLRTAPALAALGFGLAGCHSLASKAWNLSQLHDDATRHKYSGALQSDVEYWFRHEFAGALRGAGASVASKDPSGIPDPSQACLENLIELESYPAKDPRSRALRVEWCARLAVADPSRLSRERAVLALGPIGKELVAGVPVPLPKDQTPAAAEAVSNATAALVRSVRGRVDPDSLEGRPAPTVDEACAGIEALVLDVDGGRRALNATAQLATVRGLAPSEKDRLGGTALELERRLVRLALAGALKDPEPLVRAAAVEASVQCAGLTVVDSMLLRFEREPAAEVVVRVLAIVREQGLPEPPNELAPPERARWRERQLEALHALLVTRPEDEVHVAAMLALSRVAGAGFESLREEDWQAWFRARRSDTPPTSPPANAPGSSS